MKKRKKTSTARGAKRRAAPKARGGGASAARRSKRAARVRAGKGRGGRTKAVDRALTPETIVDLLTRLVDKSLVVVDRRSSHGESLGASLSASGTISGASLLGAKAPSPAISGLTRYRLLETVRFFAAEKAGQERSNARDGAELRRRHLAHYLAVALRAEPELTGPNQASAIQSLKPEQENFVAAITWGGATDRHAPEAVRLASALWRFWLACGRMTQGREMLGALLSRHGARLKGGVRSAALFAQASLASAVGDYADARALFELALAEHAKLNEPQARAHALTGLSNVLRHLGDVDAAVARNEDAMGFFQTAGDEAGVALCVSALGNIAVDRGDYERGRELHLRALERRRALGDRAAASMSLNNLAVVEYSLQRYDEARRLYEEALAIQTELGNAWQRAQTLMNLGLTLQRQGDAAGARRLFEESLEQKRQVHDRHGVAQTIVNLAPLAAQLGDVGRARTLLLEALAVLRRTGVKRVGAYALEEAGNLCALGERPEPAAELYGAADAVRAAIRSPKSPRDQAEHAKRLESVREMAGEERFRAAFARGQLLSFEAALDVGLAELRSGEPAVGSTRAE